MDLTPRKRFGDLESLRREMERLWNRFFEDRSFPKIFSEERLPSTDIVKEEDKLVLKADLPGMDTDDIKITLSEDNVLTISGERKTETEEKEENYYRRERQYGSFRRTYRLPANVQGDKIEAVFEKGVLSIILPKTEAEKKKEIEIKVK